MTHQLIQNTQSKDNNSDRKEYNILNFSIRILLLGLILSGLGIINYIGFSLNSTSLTGIVPHTLISIGMAAVISILIRKSQMNGVSLVGSIAMFYYVLVSFLTALETMIFVPSISQSVIIGLFINGAITALIFSIVAVYVHGKLHGDRSFSLMRNLGKTSYRQWIWKLIAIGVIYVFVYIASGALIFLPIAGDAVNQVYSDMQMPEWILQFQFFRGILWAVVTIPIIRSLQGSKRENYLIIGLTFVFLVATLVLLPGGISVLQVQIAHFMELAIGHCLIFGMIMSKLFRSPD